MTKEFRPLAVAGITLLSWSQITVGVLCGGEQEYTAVVSRKCTPRRERNTSTAPQNLAGFLEPARHGGESPWDIIPTALPGSLCVCVCGVCLCVCMCVRGVHNLASECMTYVFARVCMCCSGSMLDVGSSQSWLAPGVMATSRGRPSVWYSAALWGLIAVTSLGTPCTLLSRGLHQIASQLCENNS